MKKISFPKLKSSLIILVFLTLIIAGGFLRFKNLDTSPYWMDEGYTINAVLSYQEHGTGLLDSGQKYSCPIYCGITAKIANNFGNNSFNYRFLSALAGLLFLPLIFLITKNLFSSSAVALWTLFFTTFSYIHLAWAHQARWYTLFTFFFWLALWGFYKLTNALLKKNNQKISSPQTTFYEIITLLSLLLAKYSHNLTAPLLLSFIIWGTIKYRQSNKKINLKNQPKKVLIPLTIVSLLLLFLFIPFFYGHLKILTFSNNTFYYISYYLPHYSFFIILSIVAYWLGRKKYSQQLTYLSLASAVYILPMLFLTSRIQYRYIFHLTPLLFIFSGITLTLILQKIKHLYWQILLIVFLIPIYLLLGDGDFIPRTQYFLESDNIATKSSPYFSKTWASYTPQPNWNNAYKFIKENKKPTDITISSHPHFNKIFLQEAGYWLKHNYITRGDFPKDFITNDREYYVNAKVIDDLPELKKIMTTNHGFIIFDATSQNNRIPKDILKHIKNNSKKVFYEYTNPFSKIWVYQF